MDAQEFYQHIISLPKICPKRDLEAYLLALYRVIEENKYQILSHELVLGMLLKAFEEKPKPFPSAWLACHTPPDWFLLADDDDPSSPYEDEEPSIDPYDYTLEVLKFQIAELHKMRGKQLENEHRYFGIPSETGNYWYNFDPFTNLECGARCLLDNGGDFDSLDWSFIGVLLESGRMYE